MENKPNTNLVKDAPDQQREQLLETLTALITAQIIKAARQNGTLHFMDQFNKNRRMLGYLNRLPQELGRYAEALEGQVRAARFRVGDSTKKAMQELEDAHYTKIEKVTQQIQRDMHKRGYLKIEAAFLKQYKDVLFLTTVPQIVKKWRRVARKAIFWQDCCAPTALLHRLFLRLFSPTYVKIETATYAQGLAELIKSDAFCKQIKNPYKMSCRSDITEIEIRICGPEKKPLGLCVVPDVEDCDAHIKNWISSTTVRTHAKELAARYPEITEQYKDIERKLIEVQEKIDELKKPDLNCSEQLFSQSYAHRNFDA